MAKSLQDQLLQTGLIDKKKVKKINHEKRQQAKKQAKGEAQDETKLRAEQALAEKAERDRELNRQRQQEAERKAIQAQIKQMIEMNRVERSKGEVPYQFVDGKKIKKLYVTELLQDQLARGRLAIVRLEEQYELVPAGVAEKIRERDPDVILLLNDPQSQDVDEDDPYADYQIPDDLMW